mmetsp:Transcript_105865/g.207642  ORF Transcript_105865/g.207642 Transcript_105865/m.207642 type:complete len:295 (+) Transcript_105865:79-963(+)
MALGDGPAPGPPEAGVDEVDFAPDAPRAADSDSDSSDGLPALDPYWAAKLNVTSTSAPLPPPKMLSPEELAREKERERQAKARGRGGDAPRGKGMGKGRGAKGGKGWKGGKGVGGPHHQHDINDFMAWARNPFAEDGARRSGRSRSPRRPARAGGLEDFMSWAREDDDREIPVAAGGGGMDTGLGGFLEWASHAEPTRSSGRRATAGTRGLPRGDAAATPEVQPKEEPVAEAAAPPLEASSQSAKQELIVPQELQDELRALGAAAVARGRSLHTRERERDRDSDDDSGEGRARR